MPSTTEFPFGPKLKPLAKKTLPITTISSGSQKQVELFAVAGSVLDYTGSCIVNAANIGGITGFGVDEMVNRAGGFKMKEARKLFNGIATGEAKSTESFEHTKVKYVIHACGPVFRENSFSNDSLETKEDQLRSAYTNSMKRASELGCVDIAFCLLSAGVFRGNLPFEKVISLGIEGIMKFYGSPLNGGSKDVDAKVNENNDGDKKDQEEKTLENTDPVVPLRICLCAFQPDEQKALAKVIESL